MIDAARLSYLIRDIADEARAPTQQPSPQHGVSAKKSTLAAPDTVSVRKSALTGVSDPRQRREEADDYPHRVVRLSANRRVIECRDRIQWIVQTRSGGRWRGVSFCRTRAALIRCAGQVDAAAGALLAALPPRIEAPR
jgi:hypothetical protein